MNVPGIVAVPGKRRVAMEEALSLSSSLILLHNTIL